MLMKTIRLIRGTDEWLVKYDEERRTITVEGPSPVALELHRWLVTPRPIVDDAGGLIVVSPTEKWSYVRQVVDTDLYGRFFMRPAISS